MAELEDHVAENYRQLVEDPNRPETYASIAQYAHEHASPTLAAWARKQAAAAGEDITPTDASPVGPDTVRSYDANTVAELRDELTVRGIDNTKFKTKPDLIGALEFDDAEQAAKDAGSDDQTLPPAEDAYTELTDDEVRQLAADAGLDTEGDRAEVIARLDAAKPATE